MSEKRAIILNLPYPLYDTHFHALHMAQRGLDVKALLTRIFSAGLKGALEAAVNEDNFEQRLELVKNHPLLRLSAGIHPSSSDDEKGDWNERFQTVIKQASSPAVAAIGETGLDFYRDFVPKKQQETAFRDHLELAADTGLPVIVHNREADSRVLALIGESGCRNGVFHCFSSDWDTAKKALDLGFHISFAGNLSYKNTEILRDAAARIPFDRLLLETDSPYLSPQSVRGRTNHPGHIGYTFELMAEIRKEDVKALAAITVNNSIRLFNVNT